MERYFPVILAEVSTDQVHAISSPKMTFIGHPLQHGSFQINKNNAEIPVNVGSSSFQMIDLQQHSDWLETQERYMDVFNLFKDKIVFNFHDLEEYCPILNTLEQFINDTGGNGFATKGYHVVDHLKLFDQRVFLNDDNFENYFCFLGNENVVINFTKCDNEPGHGLHYSSQNIQITNVLHKDLQAKEIIQVNALFHNELGSINFCKGCLENHLYIKEEILKNIEKFKIWFTELEKILHKFKLKTNSFSTPFNEIMLKNIKRDMVTYEALENTDAFPTFSNLPEDQMNEMPKIIFLSGVQFTILHTNHKHIILRGPYGSGKSIILRKKLDQCIQSMNEKDILYYICHDQQSNFLHIMKLVKQKHHNKLIVTCNSSNLTFSREKRTLSFILDHLLLFWKDKTIHLFIDEFCGSYINCKEVSLLKGILPKFPKSNIVIALQSMEEIVHDDISSSSNIGYCYDLLEQDTSFVVYNLDYSLRCSAEVNEFVKTTSQYIEQNQFSIQKAGNFYDVKRNAFVDNEYGQEKNFSKYENSRVRATMFYNTCNKIGHSSQNGPVNVYCYNECLPFSDTFNHIAQIYISILECILLNASNEHNFVICTFDEHLYNSLYFHLENQQLHSWTSEVKSFMHPNSKFDILLTDYASVRGCEFTNFIFLLRMGSKYLKYRMIECFTRATVKLHIIVDNIQISDAMEHQLIEIWKSLQCVEYFDCKYDQSRDALKILQNNNVKYSKTLSSIPVGSLRKFPWSLPSQVKENEVLASIDGLFDVISYLCENDNILVLCEFIDINRIDFVSYKGGAYHQTLLHISSIKGAFNISEYLICKCHVDIELCDDYQRTPLHIIGIHGHVGIAKLLLDSQANVHVGDDHGYTPLHLAVLNNHIEIVKLLIQNNANIHDTDFHGQGPVHLAARTGHVEIVKFLIDSKVDIHMVDNSGKTPLHRAAEYGHEDIVKLLINNNANIHSTDNHGYTPLTLACNKHRNEVVKLIGEFI